MDFSKTEEKKRKDDDPEEIKRKWVHKSWQDLKESGEDWKQMWGEFNKAVTKDEDMLRDIEDLNKSHCAGKKGIFLIGSLEAILTSVIISQHGNT